MTNLISQSAVPAASRPTAARPPLPPTWVLKVVMAVTGLMFAGFLLFHMAGNLKVYLGPEEFNHYAEWLRTLFNPLMPGQSFLWIFRTVMFTAGKLRPVPLIVTYTPDESCVTADTFTSFIRVWS